MKYVITVSEPIASLYEKEYLVKPLVIRNFSKKADQITPFNRDELGVAADDLLIIIQGAGINIDKGAEELIDAVNISDRVSLLVVGAGDVVPELKQHVEELNIGQRVKFIPSVPWETLIKYTKSADVGMCIEKDTNLNYRYSLPNKLFDYITAGIPVIASDLPEIKNIILKNSCGIIIPAVTPEEISKAIIILRDNKTLLSELEKNSVIASESLNWENECKKVEELYSLILHKL